MIEEVVFKWPMWLLPLAALGYFELMRRLDRRWARRTPFSDEERLAILARRRAISEYAVFHLAAAGWTVPGTRVEADFKTYLRKGDLPHYVRDYLRRQPAATPSSNPDKNPPPEPPTP
jgi:hypothetical protein